MKYDGFNSKIYQLISPKTKILDIGCATGRLGEKLKQEKNCYVAGIEYDSKLAKEAKKRCDQVAVIDLEHMDSIPFSTERFDYIICSNVLEHIRNPEEVLTNLQPLLTEQGKFIIALPNIAFISERIKHFLGVFDYSPHGGLMDSTHIKFYTLKTARKLITDSGLSIEQEIANSVTRPLFFFLQYLAKLWKTLFAIEFIFVCKKRK